MKKIAFYSVSFFNFRREKIYRNFVGPVIIELEDTPRVV